MYVQVLLIFSCVHLVLSAEEYVVPSNINIDEILKNDRLLTNYINCLLDKGRCTKEGNRLKKVLPEILQNSCEKCTDEQRRSGRKVVHHLITKKPDAWEKLENKYDPTGQYRQKYKEILEKEYGK